MGYAPTTAPVDGQPAISAGTTIRDLAVGQDGDLYVAGEYQVYRIGVDGLLELALDQTVAGVSVGPDGALYAAGDNQVLKVSEGQVTRFAGTDESAVPADDLGDGGPATEAVVRYPNDVAAAADGTVYVSSPAGIRRIATDGTIETIVHPAGESNGPDQLALDAHGNLYFTEPRLFRVRVVVAASEFVVPGFGWGTMWFGVNLAVAAFVFVFVFARRGRLIEEMLGQPE